MAINHNSIFKVFPVAVLLLAAGISIAAERWRPPQTPDPEEIRREARSDAQEGRYDLALQKYVWYHNNALKYQPALTGVRLSFALADWRSLANQHAPALEEMRRHRDSAEKRVRANKDDFTAFQEVEAFNSVLREDGRTIELFKWLDEHAPPFAGSVYMSAQDVLVEAEEYSLCEKYITGRNSFAAILEMHERSLERLESRYEDEEYAKHADTRHMLFARNAAYIISILTNVGRSSDAKIIAEQSLQKLEDKKLRDQIGDALLGISP